MGDDNVNFGDHGTGPHDLNFADWMVAKRPALASRERGTAPATAQLQAKVGLLKLLNRHKAPLTLHPAMQKWARESANLKRHFSRTIRLRGAAISELEERFNVLSSRFQPTLLVSHLPDKRPTAVCAASFADAVQSLLSYPELVREESSLVPIPKTHFFFSHQPTLCGWCQSEKGGHE